MAFKMKGFPMHKGVPHPTKPKHNYPEGYNPPKGLTDEQKRRISETGQGTASALKKETLHESETSAKNTNGDKKDTRSLWEKAKDEIKQIKAGFAEGQKRANLAQSGGGQSAQWPWETFSTGYGAEERKQAADRTSTPAKKRKVTRTKVDGVKVKEVVVTRKDGTIKRKKEVIKKDKSPKITMKVKYNKDGSVKKTKDIYHKGKYDTREFKEGKERGGIVKSKRSVQKSKG